MLTATRSLPTANWRSVGMDQRLKSNVRVTIREGQQAEERIDTGMLEAVNR